MRVLLVQLSFTLRRVDQTITQLGLGDEWLGSTAVNTLILHIYKDTLVIVK